MAAGMTILANSQSVRATPANDKVVLGLIGAGGRGPNLANGFLDRGDCEFAFVADPNTNVCMLVPISFPSGRAARSRNVSTTCAMCWTTSRSTPW